MYFDNLVSDIDILFFSCQVVIVCVTRKRFWICSCNVIELWITTTVRDGKLMCVHLSIVHYEFQTLLMWIRCFWRHILFTLCGFSRAKVVKFGCRKNWHLFRKKLGKMKKKIYIYMKCVTIQCCTSNFTTCNEILKEKVGRHPKQRYHRVILWRSLMIKSCFLGNHCIFVSVDSTTSKHENQSASIMQNFEI